jgi:predicted acyl esterase
VSLEIEIWPTSVVFEPGERLVLEVASEDDPRIEPFLHTHPSDRVRRGTITIHTRGGQDSHQLSPLILPRRGGCKNALESDACD